MLISARLLSIEARTRVRAELAAVGLRCPQGFPIGCFYVSGGSGMPEHREPQRVQGIFGAVMFMTVAFIDCANVHAQS